MSKATGGNKQHMPMAPVKAPLGDKGHGTPESGPAPAQMGGAPHRAESAHSALLPPMRVNSSESNE